MKREWRKKKKKGTKSSSPPPSISQLPGWPATNNKTRAEEHLLPASKEEDKGERSRRDPAFDLMILAHSSSWPKLSSTSKLLEKKHTRAKNDIMCLNQVMNITIWYLSQECDCLVSKPHEAGQRLSHPINYHNCDGQGKSIITWSSECIILICHCQYHVSESCIDKLKRAAVHLTSLGGRYDPADPSQAREVHTTSTAGAGCKHTGQPNLNSKSWLNYSSKPPKFVLLFLEPNRSLLLSTALWTHTSCTFHSRPGYSLTLLPHVSPTHLPELYCCF